MERKETVEVSPAKEKYKILKRPVSLSDVNPLWNKHPNECTEEEYKAFYRKVFMDFKEPLFWIHLNMDYPFNLKGILYFPKINMEYESIEGTDQALQQPGIHCRQHQRSDSGVPDALKGSHRLSGSAA